MRSRFGARALAITTASALAFGGLATAASAADAATLTVGEAGVLTLPAGDGVRDETEVTVTSDVATTLTVYVNETGAGPRIVTYEPIEIVDPAVPATIPVSVDDFAPGHYEIYVVPAAGDSALALLTVGSGEPLDVSLTLSNSTIFTWSGASPRTTVATVSATDETGLTVPFTGTLTSTVGGKTTAPSIASTTGDAVTKKIYATNLGAGTGTVTATVSGPAAIEYSDSASLTVGSTAVTGLALSRSLGTVYPLKDSYRDTVAFTVTPSTTRDSAFDATGTVKVVKDGKTVKSWALTTSKKRTLTWDGRVGGKVVAGSYTVTAALRGPEGARRTASTTVRVSATAITSVGLKKSVGTVYPAKDSYRDSVAFTIIPRTTTGTVLPARGTVKVVRDGKTVKSWSLTTSKKRTLTWDGRIGGAIVPGTYSVAVSVKGPEGSTKKATTVVNVSARTLVTKTLIKTYPASAVMTSYQPFDYSEDGYCVANHYGWGDVFCQGYDAFDFESLSLAAYGKINVPSEVVGSERFGGTSVRVYATWADVSGIAVWSYDRTSTGSTKVGEAREGSQALGALKLPETSKKIHIGIGLGENSWADVTSFRTVYTYKTLQ
ncbi:hypothetical protein [Demequina phytophila]|uniref:hypothetical protein n=1 Tax=Demequina phytophila TaxID=1638981 RepID=UPI000782FBE8|nr:hypothetical protein [Demequina phytophila]